MARHTTLARDFTSGAAVRRRERRRRRIERDLRALRTMQGTVRRGQIICAALSIPLLSLLWFLALIKLNLATGSRTWALALALGLGALLWAVGKRWLTFAWLIIVALSIIVFEEAVDYPDYGADKDARRRAKLAGAIAKREALLRDLDESRS